MNGSADFEAGKHLGEILAKLETLDTNVKEIKGSMARYGERTGELEGKQNTNSTAVQVLTVQMVPVLNDIKDLKGDRKWTVAAIVGGFIAALWKILVH